MDLLLSNGFYSLRYECWAIYFGTKMVVALDWLTVLLSQHLDFLSSWPRPQTDSRRTFCYKLRLQSDQTKWWITTPGRPKWMISMEHAENQQWQYLDSKSPYMRLSYILQNILFFSTTVLHPLRNRMEGAFAARTLSLLKSWTRGDGTANDGKTTWNFFRGLLTVLETFAAAHRRFILAEESRSWPENMAGYWIV